MNRVFGVEARAASLGVSMMLGLATGCSKPKANAEQMPGSSAAVAMPVTASASASAPPAQVGPLDPVVPTKDGAADIRTMVARWNQAMATRDIAALSKLYASHLNFYGNDRSLDSIIKTKKKAFAATPDYTQSIGPVTIEDLNAEAPRVRFEKRWTQHGKPQSVEAVLSIQIVDDNKWHVVGETDGPSLARIAARERLLTGDCNKALHALVESTAEVKKLLAGPKSPAAGHRTNVLVEDGEAEGSRGMPAMLFRVVEEHADHAATLGQFEVDFAGHAVLEVDAANPDVDGKELKVDATKLEAAERSCPTKFWE